MTIKVLYILLDFFNYIIKQPIPRKRTLIKGDTATGGGRDIVLSNMDED